MLQKMAESRKQSVELVPDKRPSTAPTSTTGGFNTEMLQKAAMVRNLYYFNNKYLSTQLFTTYVKHYF